MEHEEPSEIATPILKKWALYRRVMRLFLLVLCALIFTTLAMLYKGKGPQDLHVYVVIAAGIGFLMLLWAAFMGIAMIISDIHTGPDNEALDDGPNS